MGIGFQELIAPNPYKSIPNPFLNLSFDIIWGKVFDLHHIFLSSNPIFKKFRF
jgi:hypothetical protein